MVHMHIKHAESDSATNERNFVAVGKGEIGYRVQFKALVEDGYPGCVSIETRYRLPNDREKSTRGTYKGIVKILEDLNIRWLLTKMTFLPNSIRPSEKNISGCSEWYKRCRR